MMNCLKKTNSCRKFLINWNKLTLNRYTSGSLYEPSYLEELKPKVPIYNELNIFLKGYDYPVVEHYQKFLHNLLKHMDIEVEDSWPVPAQELSITTLKPKSEIVHSQVDLKLYERVIQICDVSTVQLPIVIRAIEASIPSTVTAEIRPHQEIDEEIRYIPDVELNTLKQELEDLGGPSKAKK